MSDDNVTFEGIEYTVEVRPGTDIILSDLVVLECLSA